jgi:DNA-binding MarR family transcriptional regulator
MGAGELLGRELSTAVVAFHEAIAARLGMTAAEWRCLGVLGQHGPSTAGRLAELSGFTTGAITGIVDRLEKSGYVRREPNPRDRRSVVVHPIDRADLKEVVVPIFASLSRAMGEVASHYTPEQLASIRDYFERMVAAIRGETTRLARPRAK